MANNAPRLVANEDDEGSRTEQQQQSTQSTDSVGCKQMTSSEDTARQTEREKDRGKEKETVTERKIENPEEQADRAMCRAIFEI